MSYLSIGREICFLAWELNEEVFVEQPRGYGKKKGMSRKFIS